MSPKLNLQTNTNGEGIDWKADIKLESDLAELRSPRLPNGIVVALTGASGFLGRKVLQKLVQSPQIKMIHCIAIRDPGRILDITSSSKVVTHVGDLSRPDLGMSSEAIRRVFCFTDVVILSATEVSFSKPYNGSLRDINVRSTKEIVRLSLEHNHVTHIQFVSTSGLATILSRDLYEGPACYSPPDIPASQGYYLTKLVCELYLENVSAKTGLHVTIYRPTVIIGPDAPRLDVMHSILYYSEKIAAVPELTAIEGTIQLVEVDRVAEEITSDVTRDRNLTNRSNLEFKSQFDENVEVQDLGKFVSRKSGINVSAMPVSEWIQKAEVVGLATEVAKFLETVKLRENKNGGQLKLRRLWKGPPQ